MSVGHWGLLAVDPTAQGTGVASALVEAAEDRLRAGGCQYVQIEYEYTEGHPHSQRLEAIPSAALYFTKSYIY